MSAQPDEQVVRQLVQQIEKHFEGQNAIDCFNATINVLGHILRLSNNAPAALAQCIPMLAELAEIECEQVVVEPTDDEEDEQHVCSKSLN